MLHSSGGWEVKGQSGFRFVCLVKVVLCLQDGAFSCVFQKRRMHHHLQKMEGQESLFLKGFSPIYYESILYGSITSPVLRGAHCSHVLWLAYVSSSLTWLPPSHAPDYISNVISEKPGLPGLPPWATSAFTRRHIQHGYAHILISVGSYHMSVKLHS